MARKNKTYIKIETIRQAIADYIRSEGCQCCQNIDDHTEHKKRIAELLNVPPYSDNSGYNFGPFQTDPD